MGCGNELRHWATGSKWALGRVASRHTRELLLWGDYGGLVAFNGGKLRAFHSAWRHGQGWAWGELDLCRAWQGVQSCTWTGHGHSRLPSLRRWQVFALMGVPAVAPQPASCSLSEAVTEPLLSSVGVRVSTSSSGSPRAAGLPG